MFEQSNLPARNPMADWAIRGGIALLFISAGAEKFGQGTQWVELFQQIGIGEWFRYATGVVEIAGAILVLIPFTFTAGIFLLAATMFCAAMLWIFRLGHPGNAIFDGIFLAGLVTAWCTHRNRAA